MVRKVCDIHWVIHSNIFTCRTVKFSVSYNSGIGLSHAWYSYIMSDNIPNSLTTLLPIIPVAPKTVATMPLKELRPPRPLLQFCRVTFFFIVATSELLFLHRMKRAPPACRTLTSEKYEVSFTSIIYSHRAFCNFGKGT